jgi:hypothetical protein
MKSSILGYLVGNIDKSLVMYINMEGEYFII